MKALFLEHNQQLFDATARLFNNFQIESELASTVDDMIAKFRDEEYGVVFADMFNISDEVINEIANIVGSDKLVINTTCSESECEACDKSCNSVTDNILRKPYILSEVIETVSKFTNNDITDKFLKTA